MGNGQAKTDEGSLIMHLLGEPEGCGHDSCSGLGSFWQLLALTGLGTLGQEGLSLQPLRGHCCGRTGVLCSAITYQQDWPGVQCPRTWSPHLGHGHGRQGTGARQGPLSTPACTGEHHVPSFKVPAGSSIFTWCWCCGHCTSRGDRAGKATLQRAGADGHSPKWFQAMTRLQTSKR